MEDAIKEILIKLTEEWTPAALDLGAQVTYWNGVGSLLWGFVWFVFSVIMAFLSRFFWQMSKRLEESLDNLEVACVISAATCAFSIVGAVLSGILFFNIWNWIAIFNPHLALAHDIYTKLVK